MVMNERTQIILIIDSIFEIVLLMAVLAYYLFWEGGAFRFFTMPVGQYQFTQLLGLYIVIRFSASRAALSGTKNHVILVGPYLILILALVGKSTNPSDALKEEIFELAGYLYNHLATIGVAYLTAMLFSTFTRTWVRIVAGIPVYLLLSLPISLFLGEAATAKLLIGVGSFPIDLNVFEFFIMNFLSVALVALACLARGRFIARGQDAKQGQV